jgi:hypothetical protein
MKFCGHDAIDLKDPVCCRDKIHENNQPEHNSISFAAKALLP